MSALRASTKLIGREPANDTADRCADPKSIHCSQWAASNANLATNVSTGATASNGSSPTSDEALNIVVVENVLALGTNDVGHIVSSGALLP